MIMEEQIVKPVLHLVLLAILQPQIAQLAFLAIILTKIHALLAIIIAHIVTIYLKA